ncbi:hypothetical protein [Flavobacterium sp.]|jgi:hypothetical protein|uniref:hypothetical protein n=1 Tax=Flavobacterium sp. TaxID=239 RepID=UPI00286F8A39|nr:hypothetical protein [Flavobacterium sp.]
MKQKLLILFVFLSFYTVRSQEISFNVGTNFTQYNLKNPETYTGTPLQSGSGSFYEIAYLLPSSKEKLMYNFGLGLNEYNALAGNTVNSYKWNTKYLGIRAGFEYEFVEIQNIKLVPLVGMNLSSIIYGKQEINGAIYDISNHSEFSGLKLIPYLGFKAKYKIKDYGYISLGYNHSVSFKPSLTNKEYVNISTNQIVFGLHFNINN